MGTKAIVFGSICAALLLAGCSQRDPAADRIARSAKRIEKAKSRLESPLEYRAKAVGPHELLIVEVPVMNDTGFVDTQRCFIWRDGQNKTSSMTCSDRPAYYN